MTKKEETLKEVFNRWFLDELERANSCCVDCGKRFDSAENNLLRAFTAGVESAVNRFCGNSDLQDQGDTK